MWQTLARSVQAFEGVGSKKLFLHPTEDRWQKKKAVKTMGCNFALVPKMPAKDFLL
jgi:hypothetical protein